MPEEFKLNLHNDILFNAECDNTIYGISREDAKVKTVPEGLEFSVNSKGNTIFSFLMYREHALRFNSDEYFWPVEVRRFPYLIIEYKMLPGARLTEHPRVSGERVRTPCTRIYLKAICGNKCAMTHKVIPESTTFNTVAINLSEAFDGYDDPRIYFLYFRIRTFFADMEEKIVFRKIAFAQSPPKGYQGFAKQQAFARELVTCQRNMTIPEYPHLQNYYHFGTNSGRESNRLICKMFDIPLPQYYRWIFRDQARHGITLHWFFHDQANRELKTILKAAEEYDIDIMTTLKSPVKLGNATAVENLDFDELKYECEVKKLVAEFSSYKNMKFWFLTDEPAEDLQLLPFLKEKKIVEKYDPLRPSIFNLSLPNLIKELGDSTAFHLFDSYPVIEPHPDFWRIGPECEFAKQHTSRQVWLTLQTFSMPPRFRLPTTAEFDLMANQAVLKGIEGFNFHIYTNHPFWKFPHYSACLISTFGEPQPLWQHIGTMGRKLAGMKDFFVGRKLIKTNPFRVQCGKFDTVQGEMPEAACACFRSGNIRMLFVMNNNPAAPVSFQLQRTKKTTIPLLEVSIQDLLDFDPAFPLISFDRMNLNHSLKLGPGQGKWLLLADKAGIDNFMLLAIRNLRDLKMRLAPSDFDSFSGRHTPACKKFLREYLEQLLEIKTKEELATAIKTKQRYVAEFDKRNPEIADLRGNLKKIRRKLTNIETWFHTYNFPFKGDLHKELTAVIMHCGKAYFKLALNNPYTSGQLAVNCQQASELLNEVQSRGKHYWPVVRKCPRFSFETPEFN